MIRVTSIAAAVALSLLAAPLAARTETDAPTIRSVDGAGVGLDDRPTPRSAVSLRRVLEDVYPGLDAAGRARRFAGARVMEGSVAEGAALPAGDADLDLGRAISTLAAVADGGTEHVAILTDGLLIFARTAPDYRLLDVVFVQTDPGGPPTLQQAWRLGPGRPGLLVVSRHFNSNEAFESYLILSPREGRLEVAYDGPFLFSIRNADGDCDPKAIAQTASFRLAPTRGAGVAGIAVTVTETESCARKGRETVERRIRFPFRLAWDAGRGAYRGGSKALPARNEKRVGAD